MSIFVFIVTALHRIDTAYEALDGFEHILRLHVILKRFILTRID